MTMAPAQPFAPLPDLTTSLLEAWHGKAQRAATELRKAYEAPGLFKPERVAQLEAEYAEASRQTRNVL